MQSENVVVINPYRIESETESESSSAPDGAGGSSQNEKRVDTELLDLMPFLESIVRLDVKDVREVLESYRQEQEKTGLSVPEIFRARQTRFQQSRRAKSSSVGGFSREGKKWGR
jgi:import inner membrane translocase subunit TIM50